MNVKEEEEQTKEAPNLVLTCVAVVLRERRDTLSALPHVQSYINACLDGSSNWKIHQARDVGLAHLLRSRLLQPKYAFLLKSEYYWLMVRKNAMVSAVKRGDLEELQRLTAANRIAIEAEIGEVITGAFGSHLVDVAAEGGHLLILQWLHETYGTAIEWRKAALVLAMDNDHLHVLQWMIEYRYHELQHRLQRLNSQRYEINGSNKPLSTVMMQWQYDHRVLNIDEEMKIAARAARIDILQWLQHLSDPNEILHSSPGSFHAFTVAASHGLVRVMQWILDTNYADIADNTDKQVIVDQMFCKAMDNAAQFGHLDVVQWIRQRHTSPQKALSFAIGNAAANGHLHIVQFLHENWSDGGAASAMDCAAKNGHLDVVKWLHRNRSEGCTTDAMDGAAEFGHFEIVRWLHANSHEGCTTRAMDDAAKNGHLKVVKWLHVNRFEGCSSNAMRHAIRNGHLAVVKWLHAHRRELSIDHTSHWAARRGHFEMVKWVYEHGRQNCTWEAIVWAAENGHLEIVRWLYDNPTIHREMIRDVVNAAAKKCQLEILLFLHERDAVISSRHRSKYFSFIAFEKAMKHNHLIVVQWMYRHYQKLLDRIWPRRYMGENTESYRWLLQKMR